MNFRLNIEQAIQSLRSAKRQSLLALIGITIGIASVIAIININKIVSWEMKRTFDNLGIDVLYVSIDYSQKKTDQIKRNSFSISDINNMPDILDSIKNTEPIKRVVKPVVFNGRYYKSPLILITNNFPKINPVQIKKGRFLLPIDKNEPVCVIGSSLAKKLSADHFVSLVDNRIKAANKVFRIVGVLDEFPVGGFRPYGVNNGVLVPFAIANKLINQEITSFYAQKKKGVEYKKAIAGINQYFRLLPKSKAVKVSTLEEILEQKKKQMRFFSLLLGAIGTIALILGGVGIMNFLLVSINKRTREIGIRRALGAKMTDIQIQFLAEAVILCSIGGLLGVVFGGVVTYVVSYFANWHFVLSIYAIFLGCGISFSTGVFFGYYPALRAARLKPIKALRC
jgi:putative ABC transport system permease protein